jgi:hypothetical protein
MSADNFMAILATPTEDKQGFEYRVTMLYESDHNQEGAFGSLYQSGERASLMTEARELWADCEVFTTEDAAHDFVDREEGSEIIEYGRAYYELPEPF